MNDRCDDWQKAVIGSHKDSDGQGGGIVMAVLGKDEIQARAERGKGAVVGRWRDRDGQGH